ncbi:MalY/PatB family protein [Bifidobacterium xylocopae]|uniref:cysteine-S-conjugate beta-lyase n=1 Tax=Bifidobacterium xylocopae TaxID=2493119 RepID=A0A366KB35_9BIFI|nr:aminotransferase class I/II-fold pyridoxal phosphate-dependent enzyme [Bifidobacterium xylocopae]RBP98930.1 hypothetical protein CRD59_06445 [Bifidobacterium xylocopae]
MTLLQSMSRKEMLGIRSVRWDDARRIGGDDVIALSVADMDFKAPSAIVDAVTERARMGDYCYTYIDDSYSQSVSSWFSRRHGWKIPTEQIVPVGRMVESMPAILRQVLKPGSKVLVPYPAYSPTPAAILAAGCQVVPWGLTLTDSGRYEYDFAAMDSLMDACDAAVITNPHNPTGRVWTRTELARIAQAAASRGVLVISDEFHADLIMNDYEFQPYLTCDPAASAGIAFNSPGKTFNMAGLEIVNIVVPDDGLRRQVHKAIDDAGCHNPRFFAQVAAQAGYDKSEAWLDELLDLVKGHVSMLRECMHGIKGARLIEPEGTYLNWLDLRGLGLTDGQIEERMLKAGLVLDPGTDFGPQGSGFVRICLATTTPIFREALGRLAQALR